MRQQLSFIDGGKAAVKSIHTPRSEIVIKLEGGSVITLKWDIDAVRRCTRCGESKLLNDFGLRVMTDTGVIRNQPQCYRCRGEAYPRR